MRDGLLARIVERRGPLLADGALGTELQAAGLAAGAPGEPWCVEHPELVEAVHRRYVEAGAELLLTNTFGASRPRLERHGAAGRVAELNRAAVALARRAAGERALVLGDIGPFGGVLAPVGEDAPEEALAAFLEQARALVEAGVDGIIIETMSALDEALLAVRAAREAGAPAIVASMAFDATRVGPRTMMGVAPEAAARALLTAGADVLGVNCGAGLELAGHAEVVRRYRAAAPGVPVMVQPNAGTPRLVDGIAAYDAGPREMAAGLGALREAGAAIIGGCCGTGPAHIAAFRAALDGCG